MKKPPNIQSMARDLVAHYGNETAAAAAVQCDQSTINRLKTGRIRFPRLDLGLRLMEAHEALQRATAA